MFAFPASENEKQLVHSAMLRLKKAQEEVAQAAADLLLILENEALAVDERYLKNYYQCAQAASLAFNIRIRQYKIRENPERVIHEPLIDKP